MARFGSAKAAHAYDLNDAISSVNQSLDDANRGLDRLDCGPTLLALSSGFAAHGEGMAHAKSAGLSTDSAERATLSRLQTKLLEARRQFRIKCVRKASGHF